MDLETLYPYQEAGSVWLAPKPHAFLADDMGLGKSAQVVRACDIVGAADILVLCPASVRVNWEREFEKFSPMDRPCTVLFSGKDEVPTNGVVVCSYDLLVPPSMAGITQRAEEEKEEVEYLERMARTLVGLPDHGPASALVELSFAFKKLDATIATGKIMRRRQKQVEALLKSFKTKRWDVLVLDEAHYLKERTSDRTRVVYGRGTRFPGIEASCARVWRLSGTPAPNNASELWTHLKSAGITTDAYWDFTFRYCSGFESSFGYKITGAKNTEELKALMKPFMLRRKKEEVMTELPPIVYQHITVERKPVELDPEFYENVKEAGSASEFFAQLKKADTALRSALGVATTMGKDISESRLAILKGLEPSCSTLRRYIGAAKMDGVFDIIEEELDKKKIDKIVIFGVHKVVIQGALDRFRRFKAVTVYGGTPGAKRQHHIDKFVKDPKCRVFIGNIQAAGTGINGLQLVCNEVAFVEQSYVPGENAQAAMRIHRNGQTLPVRVRIFGLHKSIDDDIQRILMNKARELTKLDL